MHVTEAQQRELLIEAFKIGLAAGTAVFLVPDMERNNWWIVEGSQATH